MKKLVALTPGTMGLCALACKVFGGDTIVPSGWGTPVYVDPEGMSPEDLQAGLDMIKESAAEDGVAVSAAETVR